ncbi:hypothetical protein GQX73_g3785 [Xylaria multiplex]|uniref:Amino acid permease/ SLC12A domain-containing protein n=1 Tax=Xylaria multiplex TaxID=323545 RepID=A0A7C8J364_9PEZI|nr:hypothetical protein GQX73_g3785 [Xylaria multiplex]
MAENTIELNDKRPSNEVVPGSTSPVGESRGANLDDQRLRQLGKRPRLNRTFGFMSTLGLSCSALSSWEGVLVSSVPGLLNGGLAGVIWGYLINWIGTMSVYATIAELSSMAPTAGGQSWQACACSIGYLVATTLQGIVVLAHPSYIPRSWHTVLIIWVTMLFAVVINSTTGRVLAKFEGILLILHLAGFFGVLVPLVYFADHNSAATVFTTFINSGNWSTQALSVLVGIPSISSSLIGGDCAVRMSEEIQSSDVVVPRVLMYTIWINGSLAFGMITALMFCISDLDAALGATTTMFYPFLEIFQSAVQSVVGACLMASVAVILGTSSTVGVYASASRMLWSFSRDRGLPLHRQLAKLTKNALPVNAILATLTVTVLLSLIALASAVALNALLSLVIGALYTSYLLASGLLLWRRLSGSIQPYSEGVEILDSGRLRWGPWKLWEPLGVANNAFSCVYCIFLLFWSFWPPEVLPGPETFNWSVLVYGSVVLFSIVWYAISAKHYFKGPVKEI